MNVSQKSVNCTVFLALHFFAASAIADGPAVDILRNLTYVERDSGALAADVYMPHGAGPFPGILVVHGGAWRMGARADLAAIARGAAEHGYTAVAIDYRLAPQYKFPAQIYDCQAAVRWMRAHASEFKIDPEHIGGFGYSAGGHLVALLGALNDDGYREPGVPKTAPSARLEAVMAGGAPCDFRVLPPSSDRLSYWLGGTPAAKGDAYRDASPASFITADDPPMFFFHGALDMLVPINSPQQMVNLLHKTGVTAEMYTVKDSGHIQTIFDRTALEHALAFADHHLKGSDTAGAGKGPAHGEDTAGAAAGGPTGGASDGQ
jgi:acetyl esterase/lipase